MFVLRPPVEVMLARSVTAVPSASALAGGVLYEQKWDGYPPAVFNASQPYLQSRRGADLTGGFPEIADARRPRCLVWSSTVSW